MASNNRRPAAASKLKAPKSDLLSQEEILRDYAVAWESRHASLLGRKEVLTGKAKFGIFGDGKEVPQLAMARVFQNGDWRSGYYRDQTFMLAAGMMTLEEFFSQLYGDTDHKASTGSGGRMMNNHFATQSLDEKGEWKDLMKQKNSSADISPTAGQMPRLLGLGLASKFYRANKALKDFKKFSDAGNEVAFGTIGDSSTSEGHFFETINAIGVMKVPVVMSIWDDGWGISVSKDYQTTKGSISEILKGFELDKNNNGFKLIRVKGWDYPALLRAYQEATALARKDHIPAIIHVTELTQPQGHSTSGSHERYKTPEQLKWEKQHDCLAKMRQWIMQEKMAGAEQLDEIEQQALKRAREARKNAWNNYMQPMLQMRNEFIQMVDITTCNCAKTAKIDAIKQDLSKIAEPMRKDIYSSAKRILRLICDSCSDPLNSLKISVTNWLDAAMEDSRQRYSSFLHSQSKQAALKVKEIKPVFGEQAKMVPGREILRDNFHHIMEKYDEVVIFGEDVGKIGGVNQTYEGLQEKFGEQRIFDTGIREATIIGQGIGLAMRGFRPIAEIQYFDYLLYGLQVLSDDLATLQYRSVGRQKAPMIITTRGHRLEGIWHAGSPLSMVINSIRGINVLVPRNMTQAAGFYNTMLASDEPALIIEPLNAYRLREKKPENSGEFRLPLGVTETLMEGSDITLVTYGSCVRIAQDAAEQLRDFKINMELIDVQSLLPFDLDHSIVKSLQKTNKIVFFDEDVPGGATSYMMQKVLEEQGGYRYLDAEPRTVTSKPHRAAYSTDGDYFSNPNAEDVFDAVYNLMHEYNPLKYPRIF
jgi:2-oxoisovalerate dehydrogenase E1 component